MTKSFKLECKNAVYVKGEDSDGVYANMIKHYDDGTKEPFQKIYKNFKRSFYVTRPDKRDHKQKRAFEYIENCIEYKCTQRELIQTAARALKKPFFRGRPKELWRSPYIYDVDRSITTVFRSRLMQKYGEIFTPNKVAVIDIETNVLGGEGYPILVSVSCKDRAYVGILKSFLDGVPGGMDAIKEKMEYYNGDFIRNRNIKIDYFVGDTPGAISKNAIDFCHEIKPNIVAAWNIGFDLPIICEYLKRDGHDLAEIFSDRNIPREYKKFDFNEGQKAKQKADSKGVMKDVRLKIEQKWSYVDCPCPWIFSDAMQVYYNLRIAAGQEESFALDAILGKQLKISKLKIKGMKNTAGLGWHVEAQKFFKADYVAYNLFDDISVELLDEKTKDLSFSLPVFAGTSDYSVFSRQTRRTPDSIAHYLMEKGMVLCGTSDQMKTHFDEALYSKKDWIVTLDAHGMINKGVANITELEGHLTNLYVNNGDEDKVSCYPMAQSMSNAAPTTRAMEMVKMKGLDERTQRSLGIDVLSGKTAAYEVVYKANRDMLEFDDAVAAFLADHAS